jgi:hypothetical protein
MSEMARGKDTQGIEAEGEQAGIIVARRTFSGI